MTIQSSVSKYRPFPPINLVDRGWPSQTVDHAPLWCSVDLRDGNQALIEPMGPERKHRLFNLLLQLGFKEIEIGFPAASQTDFDFVRELIDKDLIPEGVTVQVLTQAREHLIRRTFESLKGAKRAIVHLYNSTSTLQRRVVFGMDKTGIVDIAVKGAQLIKECATQCPETDWVFQYSPESFTGTEMDFAVEICDAVNQVWQPTPEHKVIVNLPATVEMATPNIYADQIEWFARHVDNRQALILSIHPHNDRGTAVAAAELSLMAGADRVEGTLFGNGERTGNVDIVTLALNLYTQGIAPGLDFSRINHVMREAEYCTKLPVHPRHPYAGDLVFTAFSGSHQDAIKKGLAAQDASDQEYWDVPYLPIDPVDVGRSYEAVIRINSQSGKGGIAYLMEKDYGYGLPRRMQMEFSRVIQAIAERTGKELSAVDIWNVFQEEYLECTTPYGFVEYRSIPDPQNPALRQINASINEDGEERSIAGRGNGPIDAFVDALRTHCGLDLRVVDYHEHAIGSGADASAVAYVEIQLGNTESLFGVGSHANIVAASLGAVLSAVNRAVQRDGIQIVAMDKQAVASA